MPKLGGIGYSGFRSCCAADEVERRGVIADRMLQTAATGTGLQVISFDSICTVHWEALLRGLCALPAVVDIEAQVAFARLWKRMQFRTAMKGVTDDLFYAGLRLAINFMVLSARGGSRDLYHAGYEAARAANCDYAQNSVNIPSSFIPTKTDA